MYFKKDDNVNAAEMFYKILKKLNPIDHVAYKLLLEIYVAANKVAPEMRRKIMDDGIEINSKIEDLFNKVLRRLDCLVNFELMLIWKHFLISGRLFVDTKSKLMNIIL